MRTGSSPDLQAATLTNEKMETSESGAAPAPAPPRAESSPEGGDQLQPAALCYPEDELWDVFITFVRSTTNISVRLIGRYPFFLKVG